MAEKENKIELNTSLNPQILRETIRRHWFLPVIYVLLFSTGAFFYLRYTKPMFRSSAKLQIIEEDRTRDVLGEGNIIQDDQVLSKEVELLRSDVLFKKVISRLNLETSIYAEGEILTKDLYRTAPFEIIIYKLKDSSIINKRIDLKLVKDKIELKINNRTIGNSKINEHIDNEYFDIYFREINKKLIPNFLTDSEVYFLINDKKRLAKEEKISAEELREILNLIEKN